MKTTNCPTCGRPLSEMEVVLAEADVRYQCRHCWNRVHATGDGLKGTHHAPKARIVTSRPRRTPAPHGRKP